MDLFTTPYCFNTEEAEQMADTGADVERMIRRLKEFRLFASRHEKLATNFLDMIMLGIIRI